MSNLTPALSFLRVLPAGVAAIAPVTFSADSVRDRPSVVFAYTIKGWRLPTEGHPANHSALLTVEQFAQAVVHAPLTRPDRYTILEHLELDDAAALERVRAFAEAYG